LASVPPVASGQWGPLIFLLNQTSNYATANKRLTTIKQTRKLLW